MPAGIDVAVPMARLIEPLPLTVVGVKLAVAPEGKPATLNVTVPVKPLIAAILVKNVAELPAMTD